MHRNDFPDQIQLQAVGRKPEVAGGNKTMKKQNRINRIRHHYTRVVKMGSSWNTYLRIEGQGFQVAKQVTLIEAKWYAQTLAAALEQLLRNEEKP